MRMADGESSNHPFIKRDFIDVWYDENPGHCAGGMRFFPWSEPTSSCRGKLECECPCDPCVQARNGVKS
jgi:hypothetical protein